MAHIEPQTIQNSTFCDTKVLGENDKFSKCQGKNASDSALHVMDEKETEQFRDIQGTLGTLLLALNWLDWTDEDRATLLRCVDSLERNLIDIKHARKQREGE